MIQPAGAVLSREMQAERASALRASRRIDRPAWRSARKRARRASIVELASEHNARYHHRAHRRHYLGLIARTSNYQVALLHSFRGSRRAFLFDSVRRYNAERYSLLLARDSLYSSSGNDDYPASRFLSSLPGGRAGERRNRRRPWIVHHSN